MDCQWRDDDGHLQVRFLIGKAQRFEKPWGVGTVGGDRMGKLPKQLPEPIRTSHTCSGM